MDSVKVVLLIILTKSTLLLGNKWDCADYYWRDYHGTIPQDAIPAGTDQYGNKLYVGLAYFRGFEYLPTTVLPKQKIARATAYGNILTTSQFKILCSPHEEAFEWISIHSKDLHEYTNRNLIPGGNEVGESLYIGRVFRNNEVIVGKIFRHERDNRGIGFALGNGAASSLTYEILSYNCEKVISPGFDVRGSFSDKKNNTVAAE